MRLTIADPTEERTQPSVSPDQTDANAAIFELPFNEV